MTEKKKFKREVEVGEILGKVSESQMAERIVTGMVMSPERSPDTLHPGWVFSSVPSQLRSLHLFSLPLPAALSTSLPSIPAHKIVKESLLPTVKPIYTVSY